MSYPPTHPPLLQLLAKRASTEDPTSEATRLNTLEIHQVLRNYVTHRDRPGGNQLSIYGVSDGDLEKFSQLVDVLSKTNEPVFDASKHVHQKGGTP